MHFVFNTFCAQSRMPGMRATVAFWKIGDDEIRDEASGDTRVSVRRLIDGSSAGRSSADFVVGSLLPSSSCARLDRTHLLETVAAGATRRPFKRPVFVHVNPPKSAPVYWPNIGQGRAF
jgi:hypothetical protein